jgi:hypothetical protein
MAALSKALSTRLTHLSTLVPCVLLFMILAVLNEDCFCSAAAAAAVIILRT